MSFDEGCFTSSTVTDQNQFESGHIFSGRHIVLQHMVKAKIEITF